MVFDVRWIMVFCISAQLLLAECRVIENDDQEIFKGEGGEDPFDEGYFEGDEGEERMMGDQPLGASQQSSPPPRPYRQCSGPADCYPDECCRIGMQRYSEPSCMSLGEEGDWCRMEQEPVSTNLSYPNGLVKEVTHGFILFCPCMERLTCIRAQCRPQQELYLSDGADINNL